MAAIKLKPLFRINEPWLLVMGAILITK